MKRGALGIVAALLACGPAPTSDGAVQRAALHHLFREREYNRSLVLWADDARAGPVFEALGAPAAPPVIGVATDTSLGSVVALHAHDLDTLFRVHPDGWAAFFQQHPGVTGLLEVARVTQRGDTAVVLVGRSCGEHCRQAWRVALVPNGAAWRAVGVEFVRVPGA